jgi:hypothetical protein
MIRRLVLWIAIVGLLGFVGYNGYRAYDVLSGPHCSHEELRSARAPNGTTAAVMRENCGATDGFAYFIVLRGFGEPRSSNDDYIFSKSGHDDVGVAWKGDDELLVTYGNTGKVFRKAVIWRGMTITYNVQ